MSLHVVSMFSQYLGRGYPSGSEGEFRFVCPFCKDSEKSFGVNFVRKRFMCFRASCGVKGGLTYLARKLGLSYDSENTIDVSSEAQLRRRLWSLDSDDPFEFSPKIETPIKIPEMIQINPGCYAWDYLIDRGLTPHDIYFNELSLSPEDLGTKIYFPHRDENGVLVFWVARKYLPGFKGRKYLNPGGSIKKKILYRQDLIDCNYPVSICEGPLSAIAAGNAVATLGVLFSDDQVSEIAKLDAPILAAMDGEAFTESIKLARKLEKLGVMAWVVPMPEGKDPADLVKHGGRELYNAYVARSFTLEPGSFLDLHERVSRLW